MDITTTNIHFTVGETVATRSACDWSCIFRFTVVARTDRFVTFAYHGTTKRVGIKVDAEGREYAYPLGRYAMASIVRAGEDIA